LTLQEEDTTLCPNVSNHSSNAKASHPDILRHPHKQCCKTSNFNPHKPQKTLVHITRFQTDQQCTLASWSSQKHNFAKSLPFSYQNTFTLLWQSNCTL